MGCVSPKKEKTRASSDFDQLVKRMELNDSKGNVQLFIQSMIVQNQMVLAHKISFPDDMLQQHSRRRMKITSNPSQTQVKASRYNQSSVRQSAKNVLDVKQQEPRNTKRRLSPQLQPEPPKGILKVSHSYDPYGLKSPNQVDSPRSVHFSRATSIKKSPRSSRERFSQNLK